MHPFDCEAQIDVGAASGKASGLRIVAVTMVYNEPVFLPLWLRHYGALVGPENCVVVDHGSTDGSTRDLGLAGRVPLPPSRLNEAARSAFISDLCRGLLRWYDAVIYTDVDEMLVVDPGRHDSLGALLRQEQAPVIRAIGFNVRQLPGIEGSLDLTRPVSRQRRMVQMVTSMCKPLVVRSPVRWAPGFHDCDQPTQFVPLFLFHLRVADRDIALARLAKTRAQDWSDPVDAAGARHQRIDDSEMLAGFDRALKLPRRHDMTFDLQTAPLRDLLAGIYDEERHGSCDMIYRINIDRVARELWALPRRFVGTF